ncbi:hypothetical protein BC938DRAFT_477593 [Jimgerdemannia flammicorona]|uniref:Actin-domain-containing protein n=1 Tax=Jimgerdemannia flammicorona TaxID=994334 RepID=A0A433P8Y2_9FUNG|nr:hypothetical protein BC938DRAFT_477593 [Jimgerdemannia flammicorona]
MDDEVAAVCIHSFSIHLPTLTPAPLLNRSLVLLLPPQLVIDNGSGMCKAGFAGDDAPRAVSVLTC